MEDNFDLHEWKDQLQSKLRENTLTGLDASTKVISFLRDSIYPKLDDDQLNDFIVHMCDHLDVEPPAYRLNSKKLKEELDSALPRQLTVKLDDLGIDLIDKMFGGKVNMPNTNDTSTQVMDHVDLNRWKTRTREKYGNINLRLDGEASSPFDRIIVLDDKFRADKDDYIKRKSQALKGYSSKD